MKTIESRFIPEAEEWLTAFLRELANFPINMKLQSVVDEQCRKDDSSQAEFLYGLCYLIAFSRQTPYQIAQETGIALKTVQLLVNNLHNMIRKLDRLGEKYLHTLYDRYPEQYENDFSSMLHVTRFFNKGFDLAATIRS
jgi:hypothetical protein